VYFHKSLQYQKSPKFNPTGNKLIHADRQADGRHKLIGAIMTLANVPENSNMVLKKKNLLY